MLEATPTQELLAQAIDIAALRQSVYASNIANANVEGYRRLEVTFDRALQRMELEMTRVGGFAGGTSSAGRVAASVVSTSEAVKLDEEVGRMAQNALRYDVLLGAIERSLGSLRLAIREGRE